ncbi:DUF4350 domain-containing protein [Proteiniphilum sp. UBA5384]|uniref:DUF4350 domain-containing protein n=1 Tax=Proteiniphilum sp. UBA5384 TaxID=1947279 RepID=UPI0025E60207|nr:DUF4350 domain-containing protein [Proteiniphilum sp. UBA5384]
MSRALKIYLILFAVLIAVMIAIDLSREKPLDWSPTYYLDGKKPLDLYVMDREIDHLFNGSVVRYDKNPFEYFQPQDSLDVKKETYLFIREYAYIDDALVNKMLHAVRQGSTLFIASDGFTPYLTDTLRTSCEYASLQNSVGFTAKPGERDSLRLSFSKEEWSGEEYSYSPVFGQYVFLEADTASATALGYMEFQDETKYINFMEFSFGEGKIILHNQPVIFSNFSLLSNEALQEYAERVLSYLPDQPVVWFVQSQQHSSNSGNTPLNVVFEYPALRMTWLVFLYGLIVFMVFTAKRKQRVVPIIKPLQNTTVEFAQTIGNLYFQEGDISDITQEKIIYFMDRVRRTYHIDTQLEGEELANRVCLKSGKDPGLVKEIFFLIKQIRRRGECDKEQLVQLSTLIDQFWNED